MVGRHTIRILAACLLFTSAVRAQEVTESSLKAAFIYNFAMFTEWPQDVLPATATFTACVLGDLHTRAALQGFVKGRQFFGRAISVSQVQLDGKLKTCHLLYMSGVTQAQVAAIVAAVRAAPTLTISDADDFANQGGIAQLFVENGRMRFDVNLKIARGSRLQLSSKLLTLAAHIHDGPSAQRQSAGQVEQVIAMTAGGRIP